MPWRPLPSDRGPERLESVLDRVLAGLGMPTAKGVQTVFDDWPAVVGEAMAARTRPVAIDESTLVVAVDDPALATHVRFLEAELVQRLGELIGEGRVTRVNVRVDRPRRRR
jgi:hypothetical protein